jgi:glycosyltransferase involved in cell wall biosynthesis
MLAFVGRLTPEKGAHVVLDLYEKCRARIAREPHVFLIGPPVLDPSHPGHPDPFAKEKPGYAARLQQRAHALGDKIHLVPDAPPPVVAGHLEAADVLISPALGEQVSGGVLAEAIASGVGVIGYQAGVLGELIGRSADLGTLAPPGNLDALADALLQHLERSPDERFERGKRARQLATTELTFATIAGRLERLLEPR